MGKRVYIIKNRKTVSGEGSYQLIKKNLSDFKKYEIETKRCIQVAHVVTRNNYFKAFESAKHLVEGMGFRVVDSSIDVPKDGKRKNWIV